MNSNDFPIISIQPHSDKTCHSIPDYQDVNNKGITTSPSLIRSVNTNYKMATLLATDDHRVVVASPTADAKVAGSILVAPGFFSVSNNNKHYLKLS